MQLVIIESPLSPSNGYSTAFNQRYARACLHDSLKRGEAPYASHLLYTQVLNDRIAEERTQGMEAGFAWGAVASLVAVYTDYGISSGMVEGVRRATERGAVIVYRTIK